MVLVLLLAFCIVETFSRDMQKAVATIWETLSKPSCFESIVVDTAVDAKINLGPLVAKASVPYTISKFNNNFEHLLLNSSAFVFLDSYKNLQIFNEIAILPLTFSMQQ